MPPLRKFALDCICSAVGGPRQMFYEIADVSEGFLTFILVSSYLNLKEEH